MNFFSRRIQDQGRARHLYLGPESDTTDTGLSAKGSPAKNLTILILTSTSSQAAKKIKKSKNLCQRPDCGSSLETRHHGGSSRPPDPPVGAKGDLSLSCMQHIPPRPRRTCDCIASGEGRPFRHVFWGKNLTTGALGALGETRGLRPCSRLGIKSFGWVAGSRHIILHSLIGVRSIRKALEYRVRSTVLEKGLESLRQSARWGCYVHVCVLNLAHFPPYLVSLSHTS